jgi:two-component system sensor histidine kinase CreC
MPEQDRKRFIDNIQVSNARMLALVERMLDLTKLENKAALTDVQEFELTEVIVQQLQQSESLIEQYGFQIQLNLPDKVMVQGDKLLLNQAITNLLDNAMENSEESSKINIHYQQQGENHSLSITNKGQLDDFVIERAFERFFSMQSNNVGRKSTGLGLSFVREIMSLHQGTVTLSNIDEVICAEIRWPIKLQ